MICTLVRMCALHHFTWFINSLAHTWGDKPFCQEQTAVNNYILAFLTFGEGYHNFHHVFANDYRNGIRWYHFDPTKWLIWTLNKLGLAHNLRVIDPALINKRLIIERKNLLLDNLQDLWNEKKEELIKQVNEISERILAKIAQFKQLKEQYSILPSEQARHLKKELKELRRQLKQDWREWSKLSKDILNLKPA